MTADSIYNVTMFITVFAFASFGGHCLTDACLRHGVKPALLIGLWFTLALVSLYPLWS